MSKLFCFVLLNYCLGFLAVPLSWGRTSHLCPIHRKDLNGCSGSLLIVTLLTGIRRKVLCLIALDAFVKNWQLIHRCVHAIAHVGGSQRIVLRS